ncbi:MAG TPA: outer membrane beta-barrel protein [Gemmatimonadales bacterium]|jgi:hypothetical protein|nr:outer membrane beta-barrel protein [Gemmatimonadales bacterium]
MKRLSLALALWALVPGGLAAQVRYSAMLSVGGGTELLRDRIFQDIELEQKHLAALTLGASLPVAPRDRLGVEVGLGFGGTTVSEAGVGRTDGPSYRTLSATLGYEGPVAWRIRYRASAGVLKYLPDKRDIFRRGGPAALLLGAAAEYRMPFGRGLDLFGRLQYDFHRFITRELEDRGFGRSQDVHRLAIGLGIGYLRP